MLNSLKISGFRKYSELSIKNLGRINCVLGQNNVGKTSVLEAIYTWACGQNIIPLFTVPLSRSRYRGIQQPYWLMEELLSMFHEHKNLPLEMSFDGIYNGEHVSFEHTVYPSEILTEYDSSYKRFPEKLFLSNNEFLHQNSQEAAQKFFRLPSINSEAFAKWEIMRNKKDIHTYNISVPIMLAPEVKSFCSAKFIDVLDQIIIAENVQIYASLKRENILDEVISEIRCVFPEIVGFDMIPYPDGSQAPISVIKENGTMLPLYAYGDGVQRWFYILGSIVLYRKSIICIDGIDIGFHPAAHEEFCSNILRAVKKNNVQLFLTTHNIEFIDNLLKATEKISQEESESIKIITLRENADKIAIRTLNAIEAKDARNDFALDLR